MHRVLARGLLAANLLLAVILVAPTVQAADPWRTLAKPVPTSTSDEKVEVVELFWYGCGHCYALEPQLRAWTEDLPDYVEFVRIPAVFQENWVPLARAYYTLDLLKLGPEVHQAIFVAIHEDRRDLNLVRELEKLFAEHGVSPSDFRDTYNSFSVDTLVRRAAKLTGKYRITGVPSIAVNGRYVTSSSLAGGHDRLLQVVSNLVAREHGAPE